MSLPKPLMDMIYEYNPSHREQMFSSLVEIQCKCVCKQCAKHLVLEVCLQPSSQIFCGRGCANAWLEERIENTEWDENYWHNQSDETDVLAFGDEYDQFMYEEFVAQQQQLEDYDSDN